MKVRSITKGRTLVKQMFLLISFLFGIGYLGYAQEEVTIEELINKPYSETTLYKVKNLTYITSTTNGKWLYAQDNVADILTINSEISVAGVFSTLEEGDAFDMITLWNDDEAIVQSIEKKGHKNEVIIKTLTMSQAISQIDTYDGKMIKIKNVDYEYISNKYIGKITGDGGSFEVWDMLMPLSESLPKTPKKVNLIGLASKFGSTRIISPRHVTDFEDVSEENSSILESSLPAEVMMGIYNEFILTFTKGDSNYDEMEVFVEAENSDNVVFEYYDSIAKLWTKKDLTLNGAYIRGLSFDSQTIKCRIEATAIGNNTLSFTAIGINKNGGGADIDKIPEAETSSTYNTPTELPALTISETALEFSATINIPTTAQPIVVTGERLAANIEITIDGLNSTSFSFIKSQWDEKTGGTLLVSYDPLLPGEHVSKLIITSGTISKTVDLKGIAIEEKTPVISVGVSSMEFKTTVNVAAESQKLNVEASSLKEDMTINIIGLNANVFDYRISEQWDNKTGGDIDILYLPTAKGKHNATLQIKSSGITKSVKLSGEATTVDVEEIADNTISIYPNPVTTYINIGGQYNNAILMDCSGKIIKNIQNQNIIDVNDLSSGNYVIIVYDMDNNPHSFKVVK